MPEEVRLLYRCDHGAQPVVVDVSRGVSGFDRINDNVCKLLSQVAGTRLLVGGV
ncbi:hypothetical protein ACVW0I_005644 [Bradyrhizobium sp. LM6.11]